MAILNKITKAQTVKDWIMEDGDYAAMFKFCDKHSILVVSWYGRLKELHTPFTVKVCRDIGHLKQGQYVKVDEIKLSSDTGKTVFVIDGKPFFYWSFDILTHL